MKNPYHYKDPVQEREDFFGRSSMVHKIYSRIGAERPQSVSVVGDPKIGKTSLLWYLYHEGTKKTYLNKPNDYLYFYMSIKSVEHLCLESFYETLCNLISPHVWRFVRRDRVRPGYDLFKRVVEELHHRQKRIILFLDDFHLVTQNESFPLEFFSFLRSLANNYNLAYVTSSFLDLQKLCVLKDVEESPFFNIFTNMTLRGFEKQEALQFIADGLRKAGLDLEQGEELIFKIAGSFPYTLQLACNILFELKNARPVFLETDFEARFYEGAREYFDVLWLHMEKENREVLKQVVSGGKIRESQKYILKDLIQRAYVTSIDGEIHPFSPAFARFVAEECDIAWSKPRHRNFKFLVIVDRLKQLFVKI